MRQRSFAVLILMALPLLAEERFVGPHPDPKSFIKHSALSRSAIRTSTTTSIARRATRSCR